MKLTIPKPVTVFARASWYLAVLVVAAMLLSSSVAFADTLNVVEDSYTKADRPNDNFGADIKCKLKNVFGEERYCFAKFDLAPLPNDVIGDNVVKATLAYSAPT